MEVMKNKSNYTVFHDIIWQDIKATKLYIQTILKIDYNTNALRQQNMSLTTTC